MIDTRGVERPAPDGYDRLSQKDALDAWDGGASEDAQGDRIRAAEAL